MIKQVVVYKDRIVVDLYEGRQATGYLVAVTSGAQTDEEAAKARNPGRVDQGFVAESRWLPMLEAIRSFSVAPEPGVRAQMEGLDPVILGARLHGRVGAGLSASM
jgi:hypothetical protein